MRRLIAERMLLCTKADASSFAAGDLGAICLRASLTRSKINRKFAPAPAHTPLNRKMYTASEHEPDFPPTHVVKFSSDGGKEEEEETESQDVMEDVVMGHFDGQRRDVPRSRRTMGMHRMPSEDGSSEIMDTDRSASTYPSKEMHSNGSAIWSSGKMQGLETVELWKSSAEVTPRSLISRRGSDGVTKSSTEVTPRSLISRRGNDGVATERSGSGERAEFSREASHVSAASRPSSSSFQRQEQAEKGRRENTVAKERQAEIERRMLAEAYFQQEKIAARKPASPSPFALNQSGAR